MNNDIFCLMEDGIGMAIILATLCIPIWFFFCGYVACIFRHKFSTKCGAIVTTIASIMMSLMEIIYSKHFLHCLIMLIPITVCIIVGVLLREKIMDFFEDGTNDAFEEKCTKGLEDFIKGFKQGIKKE